MPSTNPPDPLLQRLGAIEERLQAIEPAQGNAVLTITRQLEAFIQLRNLIGPIPGQLHGWPISADFALHMLHQLLAEPPELVIEWGSGTSTFLLLQALAQAYPQRTAELIAPCRLCCRPSPPIPRAPCRSPSCSTT
jgi:hypothetical protein